MAVADHGNFDLSLELSRGTIVSALQGVLPGSIKAQAIKIPNRLEGVVRPSVAVKNATWNSDVDLTAEVDFTGSVLEVTNFSLGKVPPDLAKVPFAGTLRITDRLEVRGRDVVVDFKASKSLGHPKVVVRLDESYVENNSPLIQFFLVFARLNGGTKAYLRARRELMDSIRDGIRDAVLAQLESLGTLMLVPAPPNTTSTELHPGPRSLRLLYGLGGKPGDRSLITRSMLRSGDDVVACVSNYALLRVFIRPALVRAGLRESSFNSLHACHLLKPQRLMPGAFGTPPTGISSVSLDSLVAGIADNGRLTLTATATANGVAGAFTASIQATAEFRIAITQTGGALRWTVSAVSKPRVSSDVDIAWWVYAATAVLGPAKLLAIFASVDLFAGSLIDGQLSTALGGALPSNVNGTISLPQQARTLALRRVETTQSSATRGMLLDLGFIKMSDPFRQHDLRIHLT